jgi:ABC-type nickel/cobalt efflux system permease component RcnA
VSDANQPHEPDYVDRGLSWLDHVLDAFHDKVLRPILLAGRIIAFAFILLVAGLIFLTAVMIFLTRLINVYVFSGREWLTYLSLGIISLVAGLVIWRKRRPVTLRK